MIAIATISFPLTAFVLGITLRTVAYLDPGSGSFLLQLLIGGIVGLVFLLKTYWRQFKHFVLRLMGRELPPPVDKTSADESTQDAA